MAIGSRYEIVRTGEPTLILYNLLTRLKNRAFLREWLQLLLRGQNSTPLSHKELEIIADAVDANFSTLIKNRKLSALSKLFGGFEEFGSESLSDRLTQRHSKGERSNI